MKRRLSLVFAALLVGCESSMLISPADRDAGPGQDASVLDSGPMAALDSGPPLDASQADATSADALADADPFADASSTPDSGPATDATVVADSGPVDSGPPCDLRTPGSDDKDRVILLGMPFAMDGTRGKEIRSLTIPSNGVIVDDGMRLDVGQRPARIGFVPSGAIALVIGEDGRLVSLRAERAGALAVLDSVELPAAGYGDILVSPDGRTVYVIGENVNQTSGISTVHLDCGGNLTLETPLFYNVRLASSMVFIPGTPDKAILLGGQALFAPMDLLDLRLLGLSSSGVFSQLGAFDIFTDVIDSGRIAISPDGRTLLVPNGSPFSNEGGQVAVIDVNASANTLVERRRVMNVEGGREALFSPDGLTALVTRAEANRVAVLADQGAGFAVVSEIRGVGLGDQMALIARGALSGRVLISSVDSSAAGSNVASLAFGAGAGVVRDLGQFALGEGNINIPDAIGVTP